MQKLIDYMLCRKCDSRSIRTKAIVFNWFIIILIVLFVSDCSPGQAQGVLITKCS